nr:probable protein phosphatase 2C 75 [Ipomoea batatas]
MEIMHHSSSPAITHVTTAPVVRAMSISRSSNEMEDALCVRPNLCSLEINRHHPLHYFAVFEGHGHAHLYRQKYREQNGINVNEKAITGLIVGIYP